MANQAQEARATDAATAFLHACGWRGEYLNHPIAQDSLQVITEQAMHLITNAPYKLHFGMHEGCTLKEVPRSYIDWMFRKRIPYASGYEKLKKALIEEGFLQEPCPQEEASRQSIGDGDQSLHEAGSSLHDDNASHEVDSLLRDEDTIREVDSLLHDDDDGSVSAMAADPKGKGKAREDAIPHSSLATDYGDMELDLDQLEWPAGRDVFNVEQSEHADSDAKQSEDTESDNESSRPHKKRRIVVGFEMHHNAAIKALRETHKFSWQEVALYLDGEFEETSIRNRYKDMRSAKRNTDKKTWMLLEADEKAEPHLKKWKLDSAKVEMIKERSKNEPKNVVSPVHKKTPACYHCDAAHSSRCTREPSGCTRCAKHGLDCRYPVGGRYPQARFSNDEIKLLEGHTGLLLDKWKGRVLRPRRNLAQEKKLVRLAMELNVSPQAIVRKLKHLEGAANPVTFRPSPDTWTDLNQEVLDRAESLRKGTLVVDGDDLATPPFSHLVVVHRTSGPVPDSKARTYAGLTYTGDAAGIHKNAELCAEKFLEDYAWAEPDNTEHVALVPNVSSSERCWPASCRVTPVSDPQKRLIDFFEDLSKVDSARIRVLVIGMDGWTTNVHNLLGLHEDYPRLDITITTMLGFCGVHDVTEPYLTAFESGGQSCFLYCTVSPQELGQEVKTPNTSTKARLLMRKLQNMQDVKFREAKGTLRTLWRNTQGFVCHEYRTFNLYCALRLKRFADDKALKEHVEAFHVKPYRCKRCYGMRKSGSLSRRLDFETIDDLRAHQQECDLGLDI